MTALAASLRDAGCDDALVRRIADLEADGDVDGALGLLRCHRCRLVEAMHEAQRPIDVCDWIIRDLKQRVA